MNNEDTNEQPIDKNRFGGIDRLYGIGSVTCLSQSHVLVIGIGGVGTWAAEALARTGVGAVSLMDLDEICVTNVNRQSHALSSTIGHSKVAVMTQRLMAINPAIHVTMIDDFLDRENMAEHVTPEYSVVIDCTDGGHIKAALAAYCSARKISLVMVGSSGGKRNPSMIRVSDLARTISDPLLSKVRRELFGRYKFAKDSKRKFYIDAVYSEEQMVYPHPDGSVNQQKPAIKEGTKLDCSGGFGSSTMVTGSFGFAAASRAVEICLKTITSN